MKAISLWQPWASLWLSPRKIHETRHWVTPHRGWLAVHAAKKFIKDHPPELAAILRAEFGSDWFKALPTGAIIGMVKIVDCVTTEDIQAGIVHPFTADDLACGNFDIGRFGWKRSDYRLFETPIPYRGQQGFFSVPDELLPVIPVIGKTA